MPPAPVPRRANAVGRPLDTFPGTIPDGLPSRRRQGQIPAQDASQYQAGCIRVGNPMVVRQNHVVRVGTGVERRKTEGTRYRPFKRSVQGTTHVLLQVVFGMLAADNGFDFRLGIRFMPKRFTIRRQSSDSQAMAAKRGFDRFGKVAQAKRSGDLVGMDGVVRMEAAPLQHHLLKRIETTTGGWRLATHLVTPIDPKSPDTIYSIATFVPVGQRVVSRRLMRYRRHGLSLGSVLFAGKWRHPLRRMGG